MSRSGGTSTITLGIRSSQGRHQLRISSSCSATSLKSQIKKLLKIDEDFLVKLDQNGRPGHEIHLRVGKNASSINLKNGDVLYVTPIAGTRFENQEEEKPSLVEDEVDVILSKMDGMIKQPRTANCQHEGNRSGCIYCTPRDPFDPEHLKQEGIKFLSFHSYLRKIQSDKGKYATLEDINLKIKPGCCSHLPWPESICSACQPPALTLNRQTYRHVDNIMFENADIVDNFLAFWRSTGCQRLGFLYGRYETFSDVPLGIKAVVCAIYEPPQEGTRDSVKLHPEDEGKEEKVRRISEALGLRKIGWIFTDLVSDASGKVKHYRNINTHFLSAQECITGGFYQNMHPNVTKVSPTGKHGSKFVTVIVTGNADNQVHMEGYQVSNQCMALVRERVLLPTKDAPELGYVRESSYEQYVPDVFYKIKDEYGNQVTKVARPLPVEYLLIDVPVATPLDPMFTFVSAKNGFPTENRPMEGHLQDFAALANLRKSFGDQVQLTEFFRDFHLLVYLSSQTVHPIDKERLEPLLQAVRENKIEQVCQWTESSDWHTIEALIQNYNDGYQ